MAISQQLRAARGELLVFLVGTEASQWLRSAEGAQELLRETWLALERAETEAECIAAMRTASAVLRVIADDMDAAQAFGGPGMRR